MTHLFLPLAASILFVGALVCIQRAQIGSGESRVGPITTLFFSNVLSSVIFAPFWLLGGTIPDATLWWQPVLVGGLFVIGLTFTFAAIGLGDVSIATPVFGVKVLLVAAFLSLYLSQKLPATIWVSAALAAVGIALIQYTGRGRHGRAGLTIMLAISAATCYAHFDIAVQQWAPAWGAGRFLPLVFACVGLLSLSLIPWVEFSKLRDPFTRGWLIAGAVLTNCQAALIVFTLSTFGDAARVNIVFSLRGLWAVLLGWAIARWLGGREAELTGWRLTQRLAGAVLLTLAVALTIIAG